MEGYPLLPNKRQVPRRRLRRVLPNEVETSVRKRNYYHPDRRAGGAEMQGGGRFDGLPRSMGRFSEIKRL